MKARGFTLLELVIVLVLIGISALFGTRFIAHIAESYVGSTERAQALAGARFTLERLRRELAVAYGPSVYLSDNNRCLSFVPARAAGTYIGSVRTKTATFIVPLSLQEEVIKDTFMAIRAESGDEVWENYPGGLMPADVHKVKDQAEKKFTLDIQNDLESASFSREGFGLRYTLLKPEQVRFCVDNGSLYRQNKTGENWNDRVLMLTGITGDKVFLGYDESSQLIQMELVLSTRDGDLVLPGQLQVTYAP
ncbi:mannose-sensitive agglutinin biogenesis protein MshO [Zobellella taiwanensis]|uniref:Mannose-sensitive agglutinin biogenesis protein MshO n=1 Tax=Zobellella taiwanensis TaxID=347535 RepID=A0A2P7RAI3_9GAMM|nr:prepilin-type N-terminal cleavage/methylation domain-containing protein [Zobellella taiwanensis]PSJ47246.1 mannose-sensitive agglutinin biogenesis protein MshO [Zobellella taiwanensis]